MRHDRLLPIAVIFVQTARILNVVAVACFAGAMAISFVAAAALRARLQAKYGALADPDATLAFLRVILLFAVPTGIVVERLLRSLRAILGAVQAGQPFAAANAGRLRTIGWMLLALQLIDLAFGMMTLYAAPLHIDMVTWQPSLTGWFAVLVAFVLVRVFAAGATLQDDLAGTV